MTGSATQPSDPPRADVVAVADLTVVFAGGGTGGHVMPGLAIAERLSDAARDAGRNEPETMFLCSNRPLDARILEENQSDYVVLDAAPLLMRPFPSGPWQFVRGWRRAERTARRILGEIKASGNEVCLVGIGGFVAAPAARAARQLGIRVIELNLDAVPGKANQLMVRWADEIISAIHCPDHPAFNQMVAGMPIRKTSLAGMADPGACRTHFKLAPELRTLLVTGASQGARTINDCIVAMTESHPEAFDGWQILHLAGDADASRVQKAYASVGAACPVRVIPFCRAMGLAWGAATVAVSRAGASSVAEAIANRVPTIFVPYPWHKDLHQLANIQPWLDQQCAWTAEDLRDGQQNSETLGRLLVDVLTDDAMRDQTQKRLNELEVVDAARVIASRVVG